ncbi:MAG: DUF45 domain-containing protein [Oscillospiraceae bacterium]|nr:DUF45 domain-containing protein [Oscillospiraceae bacterium]
MSAFTLSFHHKDLNCTLIRTDRKTVALSCRPEGIVEVRGPLRTSVDDAKRVIDQNRRWINARLADIRRSQEVPLCTDRAIRLMGRWFEIREGNRHDFGENWIMIPKNAENRRRAIDKSCRMLAEKFFRERIDHYAPLVGVKPNSLKIGWGITEKWGSCNGKNDIYFTWKALFCEPYDLDYLVVHELCHILQHNHGPKFWREVARFFPDYNACRERMARMSEVVRAQGWVNY